MSRLARVLAFSAAGWLLLSAVLQALAAMAPWLGGPGEAVAALAPAARDLLLGALLQACAAVLAMRVRDAGTRERLAGIVAACCLNAALLLRLVTEPILSFSGTSSWRRMLIASGLLHLAGVLGLLALSWRSLSGTTSRSR